MIPPCFGAGRDEKANRKLSEVVIDVLAELHAVDPGPIGLGEIGKPQGFLKRQVDGWSARFERARTEDVPLAEEVRRWLLDNLPASAKQRPIYAQIIAALGPAGIRSFSRDRLSYGFLDWAMVGRSPGMRDLAYVLCSSVPGEIRRTNERAIVERYCELLANGGVTLSFDDAWKQYRMFAVYGWVAATATAAMGSKWQPLHVGLAGTERATRAITDLYVRIIVETAWQVPQILVVTFTRAATAELRDRVRTRLALARQAFLTEKTLDPFCQQLLERYPTRSEAIQRLDRALRGFDEAAMVHHADEVGALHR